jgi:drug/metabolite transporter (DMT)-like permease
MFIFLSLLAGIVYLCVNFADKAIVSKYVQDWRVAVLFGSTAGGVFALCVLPFRQGDITPQYALLIVFSGIVLWLGYFLYWKAIADTGAIFVTIVLQLSPVATLVLGYFILGEVLSTRALLGFVLILFATVAFSLKKGALKVFLPQPFFLVLASSVLLGLAAVIAKDAIAHTDVLTATAWEAVGVFLAGLAAVLVSKTMRRDFITTLKADFGLPLVFVFATEAVYLASRFISYAATQLGAVAIERVLEGARIFFAFIFGLILSKTLPSVYAKEEQEITLWKVILAAILLVGIYLVS